MKGLSPRRRGAAARSPLGRALPAAFLLLSLGVAAFGALEASRSQRSHRATATGVLADYGEFAAWSFEQKARESVAARLGRTFSMVRTNTTFARGLATDACLSWLLEALDDQACDCPRGSVAGAWSFHTGLDHSEREARWGGSAPADEVGRVVLGAVRAHAREEYRDGWPFALIHVEGGPLVAYARLVTRSGTDPREPARDTLLYGVEIERSALAGLYHRVLDDRSLLPRSLTGGRHNAEVIQVDVVGAGGEPVFASRADLVHSFPAEVRMPEMFGGGLVRASVVPAMADELVIGGLPADRTPVLLLIVGLAAALAVGALLQLGRERRLALLRQDFVASVSHELRTPLAQVRLFTETLRLGRTTNEEQRAWALGNIDREALRLTHLVENILRFSRAERGLHAAEREPADLVAEAEEAVAAFQPLVPRARATIEVVAPGPIPAEVDRGSLRQVLLNFLDNAVRYGPAGQVVRVGVARVGERVRIAVEDEGPGVPPADRDRIFEPFRRGGAQVGSSVAGSGIGLSVVREIARAHGGRTWVEDAPRGGARFVLELPALRTAGAGAAAPSEAEPAPRMPGAA